MKTNTRCKYGHKIAPKARRFDLDKFGVLAALGSFISYTIYLNIWG